MRENSTDAETRRTSGKRRKKVSGRTTRMKETKEQDETMTKDLEKGKERMREDGDEEGTMLRRRRRRSR